MSDDTSTAVSTSELEPLTTTEKGVTTTTAKRTPSTVVATVLCIAVWLALATALPFYNKATFNAYLPQGHKPEATLTPTLIQMIGASGLLVLCELLRHLWWTRTRNCGKANISINSDGVGVAETGTATAPHSWVFGVGFVRKMLYMALPALFYTGTVRSFTDAHEHVCA